MKQVNTHETRIVITPYGLAYTMRPEDVELFIQKEIELFYWQKREDYIVKERSGIVYQL